MELLFIDDLELKPGLRRASRFIGSSVLVIAVIISATIQVCERVCPIALFVDLLYCLKGSNVASILRSSPPLSFKI
jgi:hypothetical protein